MNANEILVKIIETKYKELEKFKTAGIFEKINSFEGNAIGQIGEKFIKELCREFSIAFDDSKNEVIHDEYDIIINNKKIEIKTARKGLKNNNLQFNGINPRYNHDYIILIGLEPTKAGFLIIPGKEIYDHKTRSFYLNINDKNKKLIQMNPDNQVNYKLTLSFNELKDISEITKELRKI